MLSILRSNQLAPLILFHLLALVVIQVGALPLRVRQQGATTVQTVHTIQTLAGPMIETCVITLTPITDKNGNPAVQEVRACTIAIACTTGTSACGTTTPVSGPVTSTIPGTSTPTSGLPTTTPNQGVSTVNGSTTTSSPITTSTPTTTLTTLTSPSSTGSGLVVNGLSTVTGTPVPTTTTSSSTASPTTTTSPSPGTSAPPGATSSGASGGTSAAASTGAFELPGKKLSVLPIGLGVFAGISVIALVVVGLVTYERTKYRKAFRQRKLEEMGGAIGYTQR